MAPGTVWKVAKAIYGLRISPKAWGIERDQELKKMSAMVDNNTYIFNQSAIDPSIWTSARGDVGKNRVSKGAGFGRLRVRGRGSTAASAL